jgi:LuxR family transcriptional regulator
MIRQIDRLLNATNIEDLWQNHLDKMNEFGFDRVMYGITYLGAESRIISPDDVFVLSSHDPAYTNAFIYDGHYFHAPLVTWALGNSGARSWGSVNQDATSPVHTKEQREAIELNQKYDLYAGYTISFSGDVTREKSAISLAARSGITQAEVDEVWAQHGVEINMLCNIFHLKARTMKQGFGRTTLTRRQREVLEWVCDGKTAQDIATIMGLTPATIEKHLRLARDALGVETTTQAVLKASFQKKIFAVKR